MRDPERQFEIRIMRHPLIIAAEESSLRQNRQPAGSEDENAREEAISLAVGDTVDVHTRILEGNKERIQIFSGVVIAKKGTGINESFTVRRIVAGEGVERDFPVHSPKVARVEVKRHAKVRRAKLYFLRDRIGKATRLKERRARRGESEATAGTK